MQQQFREKGIEIKISKFKFFKKQVNFLGNIITAEGYRVNPSLRKPIIKYLGDLASVWRLILGLIRILSQTYAKLHFSCMITQRPVGETSKQFQISNK